MCTHVSNARTCPECTASLLESMDATCDPVPNRMPFTTCGHPDNVMLDTGYGTCVCMCCGIEHTGGPFTFDITYTYPRGHELTIRRKQPYTRAKRFRKYLMRACMSQGLSSIPDETWKYLERYAPYGGPQEILFRLKRSKLNNKCYDSLPLMTQHMCPQLKVPLITQEDSCAATVVFNEIERGFSKGSKFVSYLYLLEHILVRIGRSDMLPFLNRIQCPKRRREYEERIRSTAS